MKRYLILARHSMPAMVEDVPAREWRLSEEGRLRAARLGGRLIPYHPQALFSSVEPKALETAEFVAEQHGLTVQVAEHLHEHERRAAFVLSREGFEASVHELFEKPNVLVFGSETADEAHERFARAVHSIWSTQTNGTVVIVSHGTVISLFVSRLTGLSDYALWKGLGLPSFIVLDMDSRMMIAQENIS